MVLCNCENRFNCTGIAVVVSAVVGVIAAFLRIIGVITVTPVFLWVTFGIAVGYLAIALYAAWRHRTADCTGASLTALLVGILGTILFSLILLAIDFVATSILGAIFTGLLLFFFSLTLTATVCHVQCLANSDQ